MKPLNRIFTQKREGKARRSRKRRVVRKALRRECLERRELMAADVFLSGTELRITSDNPWEGVQVSADRTYEVGSFVYEGVSDSGLRYREVRATLIEKVTVHDNSNPANPIALGSYNADLVTQVVFQGTNSDDIFANNTDKEGEAHGSGGKDKLLGGSARDILVGGAGDDWLEGRGGDDILRGGLNDDRYVFAGANLGFDTVDSDSSGANILDFYRFSDPFVTQQNTPTGTVVRVHGISIDLASTERQKTSRTGRLELQLTPGTLIKTVLGSRYNDRIVGNDLDNALFGYAGDDKLFGMGGADDLLGGLNDDFLDGGTGDFDELLGQQDNDTYLSGSHPLGTELIYDNHGEDTLDFSDLNSRIFVHLGRTIGAVRSDLVAAVLQPTHSIANVIGTGFGDTIYGDNKPNRLRGGGGNDALFGLGGGDTLHGDDGADDLWGGLGNDHLYAGSGDYDELLGQQDDDTYHFTGSEHLGKNFIYDKQGEDSLDFQGLATPVEVDLAKSQWAVASDLATVVLQTTHSIVNVQSTEFGDVLRGNGANNGLIGLGGEDELEGRGGADTLVGGANGDRYVFRNATSVRTGLGPPVLHITSLGSDTIYELQGADPGNADTLDFNTLYAMNRSHYMSEGVTVDLASGEKQQINQYLELTVTVGAIENVIGTDDSDKLKGNSLGNELEGGGGHDTLYGRGGADTLRGGAGNDGLYGGTGADVLHGGSDDDRFLIGPTDIDLIADWTAPDDARVLLENNPAQANRSFLGRDPDARWDFAAGNWTDAEIEQFGAALADVHQAADNTRLLKRPNDPLGNNPLVFALQGAATAVTIEAQNDSWGIGGWNQGNKVIFVGAPSFGAVYHEIGHNWSDINGLGEARYHQWLNLSGWTAIDRPSDEHVRALDGQGLWWIHKDAEMASHYARVNPHEDMAETFEAYFSGKYFSALPVKGDGQPLNGIGSGTASTTIDLLVAKKEFLDDLFAGL